MDPGDEKRMNETTTPATTQQTATPADTTAKQNTAAPTSPAPAHDGGDTTVKRVTEVALADATAKQKPSPWTKNMFLLYGCLLIATLNSCINGYDGSLMGSINAYEQYRSYFGFPLDQGTPSTGIVYAIYTIGNRKCTFPITTYGNLRKNSSTN